MSNVIAVIGILLAFFLFMLLVYKGVHIVWSVLIVSLVVIVTNQMSLWDTLSSVWSEMGNSVPIFAPIVLFGGVYAKLLQCTGVARSFANGVFGLLVPKNASPAKQRNIMLLVLLVLEILLAYGGLDTYGLIFTMLPIVAVLCEEYNIPRRFIPAMILAAYGIAAAGPGLPQMSNVLPMNYLGTSKMAGAIPGFVGMLVVLAGVYFYFVRAMSKAAAVGENFDWGEQLKTNITSAGSKDPNPWLSLLPFVVVILMFDVVGWDAGYCLLVGAIFTAIVFWRYIPVAEGKSRFHSLMAIADEGLQMGAGMLVFLICAGFASVIGASTGFSLLSDAILSIPGPAIISCTIILILMVALCGNPIGGLMIGIPFVQSVYVANGLVSAAAAHRLASFSFIVLDSLPFASGIIMMLSLCGLTHKEGYKPLFMTTVVWAAAGAAVVMLMYLIYPGWA